MTDDLDRFDRMLLATESRAAANVTAPSRAGWEHPSLVVGKEPRTYHRPDIAPPAVAPRPPRYVDYTECPMCDAVNLGIEYHGELMSGAKVHMLVAHSADKRSVVKGQPRCLGSKLRLVFKGGVWKGLVKP